MEKSISKNLQKAKAQEWMLEKQLEWEQLSVLALQKMREGQEKISLSIIKKYNDIAKTHAITNKAAHLVLVRQAQTIKSGPSECRKKDDGTIVPTKEKEDAEKVKANLTRVARKIEELQNDINVLCEDEDSLARFLILHYDQENYVHNMYVSLSDAHKVLLTASNAPISKARKPKPDWQSEIVTLCEEFWRKQFDKKPTVSFVAGGGEAKSDFAKWVTIFMKETTRLIPASTATILKKKNKKYNKLIESDYA